MEKQLKAIVVVLTVAMLMAVTAFFPAHLNAGTLEPTGPPGPTMKTLDEIPPTWSQKISDSAARFEIVLDGAAVLDKETGLVWEQSPNDLSIMWEQACSHCYEIVVGGRRGWRLPTVEELASLVDITNSDPALPTGHPFNNVQSDWDDDRYWSSTTKPNDSNYAMSVHLGSGTVGFGAKNWNTYYFWCVRGGHGHDGY